MKPQFKTAYIVQNTHHDFEPIKKLASQIVFLTNGYEEESQLFETISVGLTSFDPMKDILVPVGNVASNFIAGRILGRMYGTVWVAMFRDKQYHVVIMDNMLGMTSQQEIQNDK